MISQRMPRAAAFIAGRSMRRPLCSPAGDGVHTPPSGSAGDDACATQGVESGRGHPGRSQSPSRGRARDVQDSKLAGMGAHSNSRGNATGGSEDTAKFKAKTP